MFKILDRYIIRKFLTTFFFMLGVIMVLAMVFDIADRLSEFIEREAPVKDIIFVYYLGFFVHYGNMFSFLIIFISVIWFTAKLAQDTEIIPMWYSGRPFTRFMQPYMVAATILVLISLVINHLVLPTTNLKRLDFEERYYRNAFMVSNYFADFPNNETVQFHSFNTDDSLIQQFTLQRFHGSDSLACFLVAQTAKNKMGTNEWRLTNYFERWVGFPNDSIVEGQVKDTTFQFKVSDMARRSTIASAMKTPELMDFIEREKLKGSSFIPKYELELYQRTANPFATYILTVIGVAVSSRKKRGGIGMNIAIGLVIVLIYILAMQVLAVAAENVGFPTILAAWLPNALFGIVAVIMYRLAPK